MNPLIRAEALLFRLKTRAYDQIMDSKLLIGALLCKVGVSEVWSKCTLDFGLESHRQRAAIDGGESALVKLKVKQ